MITLIVGENSFEINRALERIATDFVGTAEKVDGANLETRQLPDLLMGVSLFSDKRLVIIRDLSASKSIWSEFSNWLPRVSDDINLVLVEPKPDKRTTTFKDLKKAAKVLEFNQWEQRDTVKAEAWLIDEAKEIGFKLDVPSAKLIVRRVGLDQWSLFHAVQKLALVDMIDTATIENVIDANPTENVFNLFEAALKGDRARIADMLLVIEQTEDPFRLFALLAGQAFQLAAVITASPSDDIAKDFGIHPYAISRLEASARKLGRGGARKIINIFAASDDDMKLSRADPWLLIERSLQKVAAI
jgi:DNA polymerase III delta subunit